MNDPEGHIWIHKYGAHRLYAPARFFGIPITKQIGFLRYSNKSSCFLWKQDSHCYIHDAALELVHKKILELEEKVYHE